MMKKFLFSLIALVSPMLASAADVTINGIIYELGGKGTTKVAKVKGTTEALQATKQLIIPSTVTDGGSTYTVTTICSGSLARGKQIYVNEGDVVWSNGSPYYNGHYLNSEWDSNTSTNRYYYWDDVVWTKVFIPASVTSVEAQIVGMCTQVETLDVENLAAYCNILISSDGGSMWMADAPQNFYVNGTKITDLVIPSTVTSIDKYLFQYFKCFNSVSIPGSVQTIGRNAFAYCNFSTLTIGNGVQTIGDEAFAYNPNLTSVTIPESVTSCGTSLFSGCGNLTSAVVNGATGSCMFYGCTNLTSVTIGDKVNYISGSCFQGTGITSVVIPSSVTSISYSAFGECQNLKTVTIEKELDEWGMCSFSISSRAFANCPLLEDFYLEVPFSYASGAPTDLFENSQVNDGATLHVRAEDLTSFKATVPWSQFTNIKPLAGGTTTPDDPAVPADITATIGAAGMSTLYSKYALNFSGVAGLKAYIVSAFVPSTGKVILTQVQDVPAETGLVLVGAAGSYTVPTTTSETYVANLLKGVTVDTQMWQYDATNANYVLADKAPNGLGFYYITDGETLAAGKAYLTLPKSLLPSAAPSRVGFVFDGEDMTTGISEEVTVNGEKFATAPVYNLAGQRMSGLRRGLNIVGGKKVVVK